MKKNDNSKIQIIHLFSPLILISRQAGLDPESYCFVVVWMRMSLISSAIWTLGPCWWCCLGTFMKGGLARRSMSLEVGLRLKTSSHFQFVPFGSCWQFKIWTLLQYWKQPATGINIDRRTNGTQSRTRILIHTPSNTWFLTKEIKYQMEKRKHI